jgi:hypothetical protein
MLDSMKAIVKEIAKVSHIEFGLRCIYLCFGLFRVFSLSCFLPFVFS